MAIASRTQRLRRKIDRARNPPLIDALATVRKADSVTLTTLGNSFRIGWLGQGAGLALLVLLVVLPGIGNRFVNLDDLLYVGNRRVVGVSLPKASPLLSQLSHLSTGTRSRGSVMKRMSRFLE